MSNLVASQQTSTRDILINQARQWLIANNFRITGPDRISNGVEENVSQEVIQNLYKMDMAANVTRGVSLELMQCALEVALVYLEKDAVTKLAAELAFDPTIETEGIELLTQWLKCITGSTEVQTADVAVMYHFLWQIKRKMLDRKVIYHLMPIFFGATQGTGKSEAIQHLLKVISDFILQGIAVTDIADSRRYKSFSQNYVCFFEEMAKSDQANVESLKNIISAPTISYKPLYTNRNATVSQNMTFIGATNKEIRSSIRDASGMRRFYQIHCKKEAKDQRLWDIVNNLDYKKIWRSINENEESPRIRKALSQITEHQEGLRSKSSVEEFLEEYGVEPGEHRVSLSTIYTAYINFCSDIRMHSFSRPTFVVELEQKGFVSGKANTGKYFTLNRAVLKLANTPSSGKMLELESKHAEQT